MSETIPTQAGSLKIGDYVMINKCPCKIVNTEWAKPGKHGSSKIMYTGIDIFDSKKHETFDQCGAMVEAPIVTRTEYVLINIDSDYLTLMDNRGNTREDIKLPQNDADLSSLITEKFENGDQLMIAVQSACGKDLVVGCKEPPK